MSKVGETGQGMLELILALGVISSLLAVAITKINEALNDQHGYLNDMRSNIFQPLSNSHWRDHDSDVFSENTAPVANAFSYLIDADFPVHNLKSVGYELSPYVLARLTHAWEASSNEELSNRSAKLTATYHLNTIGLSSLLDVVSIIPLAKELRSSDLHLGKVDADVVPESATCRDRECQ